MNRLAAETSPYLQQHADNPVDWYPWGEEALSRARREDRPILLSIGYAACHWCHVMAHESFEDPATAELMNRDFVNIKVDREERPDLDAIYMQAVVQFTQGHGGWPMTMFLTPDGRPFHGGTYFPPEARMGLPAFRQVLEAVAFAYREQGDEIERLGTRMTEHLLETAALGSSGEALREDMLPAALAGMAAVFDPRWGGFGGAPKFPPPSAIEFMLRMWRRTGDAQALEMAARTLDGMALGGMYDVLGGGFARYSVDDRWLVPHFEKMLYDNAALAAAYLHGWVVTGDDRYRDVCERTLDFMLRELALPEGGFASALDADTEGEEGLTYVWTPEQLREALDPEAADAAIAYYGVTDAGNFEGATVLRPAGDVPSGLDRIRSRLLEIRDTRPQPARDDKAIACWNGLALSALAEAGWRLGAPAYLDAARRCATFLLEGMHDERGRLLRTSRDGRAHIGAYLDDHGAVALGMLDLYTATGERRWLEAAERLAAQIRERFGDRERGGFFYTADDAEQLIARHKELDDNPTPSGQSLAATLLLRLARLRGDDEMEREAAGALELAADFLQRAPHALGQTLSAIDMLLSPPQEIAVVGPTGDRATAELRRAALDGFHPNAVYAFGDGEGDDPLPVLAGKTLVDGGAAVYICERFACRAPLTDPAAVAEALA
jgi:uncharacterized protein YyaL (SSP411 family)